MLLVGKFVDVVAQSVPALFSALETCRHCLQKQSQQSNIFHPLIQKLALALNLFLWYIKLSLSPLGKKRERERELTS